MGVPSFFNWLIKNKQINNLIIKLLYINIDYLFIDTNCLMHPCVNYIIEKYNNNELNIYREKSVRIQIEKHIFSEIKNYILKLIDIIKPKHVFMAIDGVAPMGKILQQRQRRYKYLYDNINKVIEIDYEFEQNIPKIPISSIELTPGTDFMERLHVEFTKFATKNNIEYSSYHVEGEGEHKILQYIRTKTKQTDNLVIDGMDADLLFLSLSLLRNTKHNIYVMRENEILSKILNNDNDNDKQNKFNYVDINQLKIMIENMGISINDFILICFLIGNDFIPKLLTIDVKRGGLDKIINAYKNIITKNKQIIENNKINDKLLIELFHELKFTEKYIWKNINRKNIDDLERIKFSSDLEYYNYYLGTNWICIDENEIKKMVKNYIETFYWCIDYYLDKCLSWKHGYKYHIAPLINDIIKYYPTNISYEHSKCQLKPLQQLIIAIPSETYKYVLSNKLINKLDNIKEFKYMFPTSYDLDVNKETIDWKYFVKIPIPDFDEYYDIISKINIDNC
jgi:5'-3' exonuclease